MKILRLKDRFAFRDCQKYIDISSIAALQRDPAVLT
jgi:hypothetical protein